MNLRRSLTLAIVILLATAAAASAATYRVKITNVTKTQIISPPVLATHNLGASVFTVGETASDALAALAEDADASGLITALQGSDNVLDVVQGPGVLMPGASVTLDIEANGSFPRLSAVGMLVTTNDAFFGLDSFDIVGGSWLKRVQVPAYDSGSEANTESCEHIPGPPCGNGGVRVTGGAEGFVHVHQGVHGIGDDLSSFGYDWRNPSAAITVIRVN
ncbi:MAG: spondin domain-containing protein [Acidobacteriota bacterium]